MATGSGRDLNILGESPVFLAVLEEASRVAPLGKPVLVVGERGTGKELVAARLHYLSARWDHPFLKLNCAALPEGLLESELFGHEAGAFTGATRRREGCFERADGGTLFLDEIASMSLRLQEKLLRVIEYGEFERVGGQQTLQVDVRLVGAANCDLPSLARAGRFREDLLDRLSFDVLTLPPLRARREDILLLAEHFAIQMSAELGREYFPGFGAGARRALLAYEWPGNVRELKNVVERSLYRSPPGQPVRRIELDPFDSPFRPAPSPGPDSAAGTAPGGDGAPSIPADFRAAVRDYEIAILRRALAANRYNQRQTARALGLSYDQLRGYLRKYGLPGDGPGKGQA